MLVFTEKSKLSSGYSFDLVCLVAIVGGGRGRREGGGWIWKVVRTFRKILAQALMNKLVLPKVHCAILVVSGVQFVKRIKKSTTNLIKFRNF